MAIQYDAQGRAINPITGQPMNSAGATQEPLPPGGVTITGSQPPAQSGSGGSGAANYLANPGAWIQQNYGDGYSQGAGAKTVMQGNGVTMTHNKMTPETHPWAFINPGQVDVNGKIYGNSAIRTPTGYQAGRQATDAERQASYSANNYFKNGGKGLDPRLMQGMTRTFAPGQKPGDQYRNQYGTYTQQHAIIDPARAAAGQDPWTEIRSSFSGKDQQGGAVNYGNQASQWGNRGPGLSGRAETQALAQALRGGNAAGLGQYSGTGAPPPTPPGTLPGNGALPGNGTLPGAGNSYIGLPPPGATPQRQAQQVPDWWKAIQQRRPGSV